MMSQTSKREPMAEVRARYTLGNRTVKGRILDELVTTLGYHRKYAIWLLNHPSKRRARKRRESRPKRSYSCGFTLRRSAHVRSLIARGIVPGSPASHMWGGIVILNGIVQLSA